MRCLVLSLAWGCSLLGGFPQLAAQTTGGFLGFDWGTPLERMEATVQLLPIGRDSLMERYAVDIHELAGVKLQECHLEFTTRRLSGIALITRGHRESQKLLAHLQKTYGPGRMEDPRGYQWFTKDIHVSFDEDSAGDAYVYCYSLPHQPGAATKTMPH